MRICRSDDDRLGVVLRDDVVDVSGAVERLAVPRWPLPFGDPLFGHLDALRPELERLSHTGPRKPLSTVRLKSPVATPSKLMAAPVNYRAHQAEALPIRVSTSAPISRPSSITECFSKALPALLVPARVYACQRPTGEWIMKSNSLS